MEAADQIDQTAMYPPTDPTGDIDLSLIDQNLSLSMAERIRQHDRALAMVEAFRRAGEEFYARQSRPAPAPDR